MDDYRCPRCPAVLGRTPASPPGSRVRCPECRHVFPVPPADAVELPLLLPEPEGRPRPRRAAPRRVQLTNQFTPDLRLWCRMAAGPWADFLWPFLGFVSACGAVLWTIYLFSVFTAPILMGLPLLGLLPVGFLQAMLALALPMGPAINAVLGREYELNDFLSGIQRIVPILLYTAMNGAFVALTYGPPIAGAAWLMMDAGGPDRFFASMSVAAVAGAIGYAMIAVPLLYLILFTRFSFVLCLVYDRRMGYFEAMATSWRMTAGHFWPLFLLLMMQVGLTLAGLLTCGIGLGFTGAYSFLLRAAAYVHATTPPGEVAYAAPGGPEDEDDAP